MDSLAEKVCLVTGASRGIGKSIALALAGERAKLCLVGREIQTLEDVARSARMKSPVVTCFEVDLRSSKRIAGLSRYMKEQFGGVDILVNCAGTYVWGNLDQAPVEELDKVYEANVRAPFVLTQSLLPMLKDRVGQIVFVNSPQAVHPSAFVGFYAASQHALKAITDVLRQEVNEAGVRVLAVYPGRTATPRMEAIFRVEGKPYHPAVLLQPEDIATMVVHTLKLPRTAEVTCIHIRPMKKSY